MVISSDTILDEKTARSIGNKAKNLIILKKQGFSIPNFVVLDSNLYEDIIAKNGISKKIKSILSKIEDENIEKLSIELSEVLKNIEFDIEKIYDLKNFIDDKKTYAIRSSGFLEDCEKHSFAGIYDTYLNISKKEDIEKSILSCYKSMFSMQALKYIKDNLIDVKKLNMSVIVQEMVQADYSGVAFTVNPISAENDKEISIEVVKGLGDKLVGGKSLSQSYKYDWYNDLYKYDRKNTIIRPNYLKILSKVFLNIQIFFGYPCDIEFAVKNDEIYILQSRKITSLKYNVNTHWTTANFKDSGVSANVCKPFMWSLYEYVWERVLRKFLFDSKLMKIGDCQEKLSNMYCSRGYWNLSVVKKAMSKVVGYKERDFDSSIGIDIDYEGNGYKTKITPKSLFRLSNIVLSQRRILKVRKKKAVFYKDTLLKKYEYYKSIYDFLSDEEVEKLFYELTKNDYLKSESIYFYQIFINTVNQTVNQHQLTKYISKQEYFALLGNISDISHLRTFEFIKNVSKDIRKDKNSYLYWKNTDISKIEADLYKNDYHLDKVKKFIDKFGYHSKKELDISYPCYSEDIVTVIGMFKDMVCKSQLQLDFTKDEILYEQQLLAIKSRFKGKKYKMLKKKLDDIRLLLWWREEFKDISTRFYYLIRIYAVKLSRYYYEIGVLKSIDDIWYLKVEDLWNYIDKKITRQELNHKIEKNSDYYNSFRNYMSDNEIRNNINKDIKSYKENSKYIIGIGCSKGIVTGRAKIVENFEDMYKLEKGDILITKFTDTGWTPKLSILSGIVTACGGILCHLAIISREYDIPCIVGVDNVTNRIKDNSIISINGSTGVIKILKSQEEKR